MYELIYDYEGENDSCLGITEHFETWKEAHDRYKQLKECWEYCNFEIIEREV